MLEVGGTNERYTKLANNPNAAVDIMELSQSAAANGYDAGLFEKIDYSKIPNAEFLIDPAKQLAESGAGAAYVINSIGIIYDKEAVGFEINDWSDLWNEKLKGKISIPDITTTFGPAMVYVANDYAKGNIESDEGKAAFKALEALKPNIVKTYAKSSDLANMFAFGTIQNLYEKVKAGEAELKGKQKENIEQNKELAYEYVNWRLSQELQEKTAVTLNEAPTNKNVELSAEVAQNKTYGEVAQNARTIDYSFVNPLLNNWIDQWNRLINR